MAILATRFGSQLILVFSPLPPTHIEVNWAACDGCKPDPFAIGGVALVCNPTTMEVNALPRISGTRQKVASLPLCCVVGGGWLSFSLSCTLKFVFFVVFPQQS